MKLFYYIACFFLCSCLSSQNKINIPIGDAEHLSPNEKIATFGEGCFWHTEIIFQSLQGVRDAVSGYAGGETVSPGYEEVSSGKTGHAEVVQVFYDPQQISFKTLVKAFFASHDPTSVNGQGNDIGTQYRSIIFYRNEDEKKIIEEEISAESSKHKNKIVTEVVPFKTFYPAEAYHQEYVFHHPNESYVKNVSIRDYKQFLKSFNGPFKPGIKAD